VLQAPPNVSFLLESLIAISIAVNLPTIEYVAAQLTFFSLQPMHVAFITIVSSIAFFRVAGVWLLLITELS
jgi:hypothetical protein